MAESKQQGTWITYRETSAERHERLVADGDWDSFVETKEALIAGGLTKKKAYWAAAEQFPHSKERGERPCPPDSLPVDTNGSEGASDGEVIIGLPSEAPSDPTPQSIRDSLQSDKAIIRHLAELSLGREASGKDVVNWVLDRVDISWKTILDGPDTIPSSSAITMLKMAKVSSGATMEFLKGPWMKSSVDKAESTVTVHSKEEPELTALLEALEQHGGA